MGDGITLFAGFSSLIDRPSLFNIHISAAYVMLSHANNNHDALSHANRLQVYTRPNTSSINIATKDF